MIGNQQQENSAGQKRNFNEEQAYLNEQNDEIDVEGGREMPQNVLFETGKTNRGNLCLWHEGFFNFKNSFWKIGENTRGGKIRLAQDKFT